MFLSLRNEPLPGIADGFHANRARPVAARLIAKAGFIGESTSSRTD